MDALAKDKIYLAALQEKINGIVFRYDPDNTVNSPIGGDSGKWYSLTLDESGVLHLVVNLQKNDYSIYYLENKFDHIFRLRIELEKRDWYFPFLVFFCSRRWCVVVVVEVS